MLLGFPALEGMRRVGSLVLNCKSMDTRSLDGGRRAGGANVGQTLAEASTQAMQTWD